MRTTLTLLLFFISLCASAQQAIIQGVILDENNEPVADVNVSIAGTTIGTASNEAGYYKLVVPANEELTVVFTSILYKETRLNKLVLQLDERYELNPVLSTSITNIGTVVLNSTTRKDLEGITTVSPTMIRKMSGPQPGVEYILKSLPGVSGNNELSTQYNVRGGNFDENLVYINEIEVYRPFLIRSGQQEGLSIINSDLIRNVDFSAGGFQAQYGDKLSSVLDIEYRRPTSVAAGIDASLLGVNAFVEGNAFKEKFTGILGVRYRDNSLLVNSRQTESFVQPRFFDAQTYLTYKVNKKFEVAFLGNIAINSYDFQPLNRQTNFGTLQDPQVVVIDYEGREVDQYETYFGALKASYDVNENLNLRFISSVYHTQEQEHFSILARYGLGTPNTDIGSNDLGSVDFVTGIGSELEHGRNDLDALIFTAEHRGTFTVDGDKKENDQIDWGIKYAREDIRDRVREFNVVDSAGFNVRPPLPDFVNDQPYTPFTGPLVPFESVRANNDVQVTRLQAFGQYSSRGYLGDHEVFWNAGARMHLWNVNGEDITSTTQTVFSPRAQFAIKPAWRDTDMLFRVASGLYYQPPFYRELRNQQGEVVPDVKAQRSVHFILANEWSFKWLNKPFKLTSEAYYKDMTNVNTYTLENVRIRYNATNDAVAYAYGFDFRMNGEFVKGTESWISMGIMQTEENQNGRGFIARPTDQRFKFAMLFQDYVPNIPNLKLYLNLVYNTGLPGGSPNYADPYDFQFRLPDYRRVDIGVNLVLKDDKKKSNLFEKFEEVTIGAEIYNLFDNANTISNIWVRDIQSNRQIAIPNLLTPRVFNVRLTARW